MHIFARITKIDVAKRQVTGILAQEMVDRSGEIFDYETSKAHFQSWSEGISKATEGKSVGNMRSMHSNLVAGKFVEVNFNDVAKSIEVVGDVIDDNEWKKCESGCYTGFSIGGRYEKKWADPTDPTKKRYTAIPSEGSLVDLPCIPTAQFKMVKADGSDEMRKFHVEDVSPVAKVLLVDNALAKALPALGVLCTLLGVEKIEKYDEANLTDLLGKAAAWDGDLAATVKVLDEGIREIAAKYADPEAVAKAAAADHLTKVEADLSGALAKVATLEADLTKAATDLTTATADLAKAATDRDAALAKADGLAAEIVELKKLKAAPTSTARVIEKSTDNGGLGGTGSVQDVKEVKKADGTIDHMATAMLQIKAAQGIPVFDQSKM